MATVPVNYPYEVGTWYHRPNSCHHSREEQTTTLTPPKHIEHKRRVVERIVKTPYSERTGKILEEDGRTSYFLDGKQVTRAQFNAEQWF